MHHPLGYWNMIHVCSQTSPAELLNYEHLVTCIPCWAIEIWTTSIHKHPLNFEQPVTCICWAIEIWSTCIHMHLLQSYLNLNNLSSSLQMSMDRMFCNVTIYYSLICVLHSYNYWQEVTKAENANSVSIFIFLWIVQHLSLYQKLCGSKFATHDGIK